MARCTLSQTLITLLCVHDLTFAQANVMLAYPLVEAEALLDSKLEVAESSLSNCEEDLDFLREQITVSTALSRVKSPFHESSC